MLALILLDLPTSAMEFRKAAIVNYAKELHARLFR